ncbi:MAG: DUF58 domain-containing protein [Gammaproteobacteria bacterium]|nr:DUF58 domain-containing protein [Gammaproteobacteria bacterium]
MTAISSNTLAPELDGVVSVSLQSLIRLGGKAQHLTSPRSIIRASLQGLHLSPFKGRGMDFAETRPYEDGDDVRNLDWRVTARSGKLHTKLFQEERERPVLLCVDLQPPMFFATRGVFKSVIAAQAAALLAWNAWKAGDRVGGLIFDGETIHEVRPLRNRSRLLHLLKMISEATLHHPRVQTPQAGTQQLSEALSNLRRVVTPGSRIFLLSDFHGIDAVVRKQLAVLARRSDLYLLMISDPMEQQFPAAGQWRVTDSKRFLQLDFSRKKARIDYQEQSASRVEKLQQLAHKHHFSLIRLSTQDDIFLTLQQHLAERNR